jgi:hypothetical protein
MEFLPTVIEAEYRGEYLIKLTFNDGVEETIDFAQWLYGTVFEPLKDVGYFQRFFLEGGTVHLAQWSRHCARDASRVGEGASSGLMGR